MSTADEAQPSGGPEGAAPHGTREADTLMSRLALRLQRGRGRI